MKLMTLKEWAETTFTANSRPARTTLYDWISRGDIPVRKIGRQFFVEVRENGQETENPAVNKARSKLI